MIVWRWRWNAIKCNRILSKLSCLFEVFIQKTTRRYAFVVHRTPLDAECNRRRPIDYQLFGSDCRVEYAKDRSHLTTRSQTFDRQTIVVSQIPDNVTEKDLYNLFVGCDTLKYCPPRTIYHPGTSTSNVKNKTFPGWVWFWCKIVQDRFM